jgi:hypothetical protein
MTSPTLIPWTELLSKHWSNVTDEYGPHSQAVASALVTLDKTRWLEQVGRPWQERVVDRPDDVTTIRSRGPGVRDASRGARTGGTYR